MNSTLFRYAARKVNFDHYYKWQYPKMGACEALVSVTGHNEKGDYTLPYDYERILKDHFRPAEKFDTNENWGFWWDDPNSCSEEDNNARVMALLFCELIAEDENNEVPKNRF